LNRPKGERKVSAPEEEKEPDEVSYYLGIREKQEALEEEKDKLLKEIVSYNGAAPKELITRYNAKLSEGQELTRQLKQAQEELSNSGWVIIKDGGAGFQVGLEASKKGHKIFKITDTFGHSPVKKGEAFLARLSMAHTIPQNVRKSILELFTFKGDEAEELYANIPLTEEQERGSE
jgi:hypothetical protein